MTLIGPPIDEVVDTAVGVLGDSIDYDGRGWDGRPWFMLMTPDEDGQLEIIAQELEAEGLDRQLAEIVETFRELLPVACAYVKRISLAGGQEGDAAIAVLVALDGAGGEAIVPCQVELADDERQILVPIDGLPAELLAGAFEGTVDRSLALARASRESDDLPADSWERLAADARTS